MKKYLILLSTLTLSSASFADVPQYPLLEGNPPAYRCLPLLHAGISIHNPQKYVIGWGKIENGKPQNYPPFLDLALPKDGAETATDCHVTEADTSGNIFSHRNMECSKTVISKNGGIAYYECTKGSIFGPGKKCDPVAQVERESRRARYFSISFDEPGKVIYSSFSGEEPSWNFRCEYSNQSNKEKQ